jgi:hypothetical protein
VASLKIKAITVLARISPVGYEMAGLELTAALAIFML